MKALLIEFDIRTGKRAGGISPKDPSLPCRGWQDLNSTPAREIRLVEDARDISQYQGIPGVTILEGQAAINSAIEQVVPERYFIQDQVLFTEHLRQRKISLDDYPGRNPQEILKDLHQKGITGITMMPIKRL